MQVGRLGVIESCPSFFFFFFFSLSLFLRDMMPDSLSLFVDRSWSLVITGFLPSLMLAWADIRHAILV